MKGSIAYIIEKGRPVTNTISATAGNVTTTISGSTGYKMKLLYGQITIVCDANASDRYITIAVQTTAGANLGAIFNNTTAFTAGQTKTLRFFKWVAGSDITFGTNSSAGIGDIVIYGTDKLVIYVYGGLAGDSYSGNIKYLKTRLG